MSAANPEIDPHIALQIALAAKLLQLDVAVFVMVLIKALGTPLSQPRLNRLRINRLKLCLQRFAYPDHCPQVTCNDDLLYRCIEILKGHRLPKITEQRWEVQSYSEGQMPHSIRVACSCMSRDVLDASFSTCTQFLIYQVSLTEIRLIAVRPVLPLKPELDAKQLYSEARSNKEQRLKHCVAHIADCNLLYTQNIGSQAAAQVIKAGVLPIKIPHTQSLSALLADLQQILKAPPPWLAKAMGIKPMQRPITPQPRGQQCSTLNTN